MTPEQIVALKARINEVLPTGTGTINAASFRTILNEIIDEVEASDERLEKVLVPYDTGVYLRVFDTDGIQQVEWDFRTDGTLFKNGTEFTGGDSGGSYIGNYRLRVSDDLYGFSGAELVANPFHGTVYGNGKFIVQHNRRMLIYNEATLTLLADLDSYQAASVCEYNPTDQKAYFFHQTWFHAINLVNNTITSTGVTGGTSYSSPLAGGIVNGTHIITLHADGRYFKTALSSGVVVAQNTLAVATQWIQGGVVNPLQDYIVFVAVGGGNVNNLCVINTSTLALTQLAEVNATGCIYFTSDYSFVCLCEAGMKQFTINSSTGAITGGTAVAHDLLFAVANKPTPLTNDLMLTITSTALNSAGGADGVYIVIFDKVTKRIMGKERYLLGHRQVGSNSYLPTQKALVLHNNVTRTPFIWKPINFTL